MNRDVVIGIAGAVALVTVMVGVFAYEYNNYDMERTEVTTTLSESATFAEGDSQDYTFDVDGNDLLRVGGTVTWTDDVGDADSFRVALINPDGIQVFEGASSTGEIVFDRDLQEVPEEGGVPAAWEGSQEWTVRITLDSAPGSTGAVPVLDEADGAQAFDLEWREVRYQAAPAA